MHVAAHDEQHDLGLAHDLAVLQQRRRALRWLAGAGSAALLGAAGCGGGSDDAGTTTTTTDGTGATGGSGSSSTTSCSVIPEETAGPYPGDGSNGANALALSGIVRSDIRSSIAGGSGTADGVPLVITIELVNTNASCADLAGYAIYLWHCDAQGRYSMYSSGVAGENYLRGVQVTGSDGVATFTTIVPGCYAGRMPHMQLRNWFDDPFFQVSADYASCTLPAGPFVDERGRREQAHRRAEKGTTCWLANECDRPKAYAYDADIAQAIRAAFAQTDAFADTTLWITVQGRVVYIEGCARREATVARAEALVRSLPHVQQAIAIVRTDPSQRPPYALRHPK